MISRIIKVEGGVISRSRRLRLITFTETLIILDITKTESNNCFIIHWRKKKKWKSCFCFFTDGNFGNEWDDREHRYAISKANYVMHACTHTKFPAAISTCSQVTELASSGMNILWLSNGKWTLSEFCSSANGHYMWSELIKFSELCSSANGHTWLVVSKRNWGDSPLFFSCCQKIKFPSCVARQKALISG